MGGDLQVDKSLVRKWQALKLPRSNASAESHKSFVIEAAPLLEVATEAVAGMIEEVGDLYWQMGKSLFTLEATLPPSEYREWLRGSGLKSWVRTLARNTYIKHPGSPKPEPRKLEDLTLSDGLGTLEVWSEQDDDSLAADDPDLPEEEEEEFDPDEWEDEEPEDPEEPPPQPSKPKRRNKGSSVATPQPKKKTPKLVVQRDVNKHWYIPGQPVLNPKKGAVICQSEEEQYEVLNKMIREDAIKKGIDPEQIYDPQTLNSPPYLYKCDPSDKLETFTQALVTCLQVMPSEVVELLRHVAVFGLSENFDDFEKRREAVNADDIDPKLPKDPKKAALAVLDLIEKELRAARKAIERGKPKGRNKGATFKGKPVVPITKQLSGSSELIDLIEGQGK